MFRVGQRRGQIRRWVAAGGRESVEIMALTLVPFGNVATIDRSLAAAAPPVGGGSGLPVFPFFACVDFTARKGAPLGPWKAVFGMETFIGKWT